MSASLEKNPSELDKFGSFSGGHTEGATPVPIPNTEVKPLWADGTALETAWESRSPPGIMRALQATAGLSLFQDDSSGKVTGGDLRGASEPGFTPGERWGSGGSRRRWVGGRLAPWPRSTAAGNYESPAGNCRAFAFLGWLISQADRRRPTRAERARIHSGRALGVRGAVGDGGWVGGRRAPRKRSIAAGNYGSPAGNCRAFAFPGQDTRQAENGLLPC